jgi:predicted transcriptional regulator
MRYCSDHHHLSSNQAVICHFLKQGDLSAVKIARWTKIAVRTVRYNNAKIKKYGTMKHRDGNGRPSKIRHEDSSAIDQWIRRNNEITA